MNIDYLPRILDEVLDLRMRHHPAILIVGPRATGKTTTAARHARTVLRLDREGEAAAVRADPDAAIRQLEEPILIDEWQAVPAILGAVKRAVDSEPRPGRFLIAGSVRGTVDTPLWPGTGRLLKVPMYGMTVGERDSRIPAEPFLDKLSGSDPRSLLDQGWDDLDLRDYAGLAIRGGFPEPAIRLPPSEWAPWMDSYLEVLLSRDVTALSARPDPDLLRRYFEAYAVNTAGTVTQQTLNETAGISKATGEGYDSLLQQLVVVESLPAWWSNRLERLTKAPKRYVVEPALALAALRVDLDGLMRDADLIGRILDTLVVAHLRADLPRCASRPRLYHLRTREGRQEVDILVEYGGGHIFALEVKATASPNREDARHILWLRDQIGDRFLGGAVLHTGPAAFELDERVLALPISALWAAG